MAKKTYIRDDEGKARIMEKLYFRDEDGKARKVRKLYARDENGLARLVFAASTSSGGGGGGTVSCSHNWEYFNSVDATCTTKGYTTYKCSKCGERYTDEFPATGHSTNASGYCIVCGAFAPSGGSSSGGTTSCSHNMVVEVDYAPTCTTMGGYRARCSICGYVNSYTIPKTAHKYWDGVCMDCGATQQGT